MPDDSRLTVLYIVLPYPSTGSSDGADDLHLPHDGGREGRPSRAIVRVARSGHGTGQNQLNQIPGMGGGVCSRCAGLEGRVERQVDQIPGIRFCY